MLESARALITPSARSAVPPFMVMDVMAAAARIEAAGGHVVHMEVGQPAAPAPRAAIAAAQAALARHRLGYTEALGISSLRARIARHYAQRHAIEIDPKRIVITTGSSAGFVMAFLALFDPGDRVAVAVPGYPPYRHILKALGCEPVLIESPANPTGTMMTADALASLIAAAESENIRFISDEIYHGLDYAFAAETAARLAGDAIVINSFSKYFCMTGWRVGWMVLPEALVRPLERLQGNLAISVPTLAQIAAEAAFDAGAELDAVKHVYEENRRVLVEGLPGAGLDRILPVDGAFYLYADISGFSSDSFAFARQLLEEAHVAATPGIDFDPVNGTKFLRFCYAGSTADMHEAVKRVGNWLGVRTR